MTVAQKFVPIEVGLETRFRFDSVADVDLFTKLWVPFFNAIQFVLGVSSKSFSLHVHVPDKFEDLLQHSSEAAPSCCA